MLFFSRRIKTFKLRNYIINKKHYFLHFTNTVIFLLIRALFSKNLITYTLF